MGCAQVNCEGAARIISKHCMHASTPFIIASRTFLHIFFADLAFAVLWESGLKSYEGTLILE
jgi:hypothetical protein